MTIPAKSYIGLADEIAEEINSGKLAVGERLLPQRIYAYSRGIAVSTAGRVYEELVHRRLVVGEVGRGTYVAAPPVSYATAERHDWKIDLEFNFPCVPEQAALIGRSLTDIDFTNSVTNWQRPVSSAELREFQTVASRFLGDCGWSCSPQALSFAAGGRQAIAAAITAVVPRGGRLAVEALSYQHVRTIAEQSGARLVSLPIDDQGLVVDALREADGRDRISAVYIQPVLHNPMGCSLSEDRRRQLVKLCREREIPIIEDLIYSFLSDMTPLSAVAPELTISIDSFSKRVAPGIGVGLIQSPLLWREKINAAIRSGGWSATGLSMDVAGRLMSDGTAKTIESLKRKDAVKRQKVVNRVLYGCEIRCDERSYLCWLHLPKHWRASEFVDAAACRRIAVSPGASFATSSGYSPNAVRIALASPRFDQLEPALQILADIVKLGPQAVADRAHLAEVC